MHVSYWCVLIAALLPLLFTAIAKSIGRRSFTNYSPRDFQAQLTGLSQRAHWAHLNSLEAFAPFAAGVLIAQQIGATQRTIDMLAVAFVVLRLIYGVCYMANLATLRSLIWTAALACTVGLFVIGA
jgi:uncharacterized MAPEG superfamily protein